MEEVLKKIEKIERDIESIKTKRITQSEIIPDAVKTRHMGEPNRFILSGAEADIPDGSSVQGGVVGYFATDTNKLYIWNGTAYKSVTLV